MTVYENSELNIKLILRKDYIDRKRSKLPNIVFVIITNEAQVNDLNTSKSYKTFCSHYYTDINEQQNCQLGIKAPLTDSSRIKSIFIKYQFIEGVPENTKSYSFDTQNGIWKYYGANGLLFKTCYFEKDIKKNHEVYFNKGKKSSEREYVDGKFISWSFYRKNGSKQIDYYSQDKRVRTVLYDKKGFQKRIISY